MGSYADRFFIPTLRTTQRNGMAKKSIVEVRTACIQYTNSETRGGELVFLPNASVPQAVWTQIDFEDRWNLDAEFMSAGIVEGKDDEIRVSKSDVSLHAGS